MWTFVHLNPIIMRIYSLYRLKSLKDFKIIRMRSRTLENARTSKGHDTMN